MDSEEIKQFLKDNLEIVVEFENPYSVGLDQKIGLKFKGDEVCFTKETIYISQNIDGY